MNHGTCICIRQLVMRCRQSMAVAIVLIVPLAGFHVAAARDSAALPELTIVDHVACYTVTVTSVRSIRAQLESRSQTGGESRHGSTRSTFEVISKLEEVGGLCRVSRRQLALGIDRTSGTGDTSIHEVARSNA